MTADGKLRLVYGTPDWPDYVTLAVSEIRHFGEGSMQVNRRLRAMLEHLIRELPEDRRPPLEEELALLSECRQARSSGTKRTASAPEWRITRGSAVRIVMADVEAAVRCGRE